ncbi:Aldo/keto reductase [Xylaria cubensis]|nr:Aldo/keto reductase [Xylaria cubensis]
MSDQNHLRVVLGLMVLGPPDVPGARLTGLDNITAAFDMFQARGHTEIDTARLYLGGKQEAFTRDARWKERGLQVGTKTYPIQPGLHAPEALAETLETSLKELGTESVEIFYLHAPDRSIPFAPTLEALDKLYKAGKFKRLGLSNYTSFEVAEIALTCAHRGLSVRPTVYQALYNPLFRNIEDELIPACRRYGLAIDAYSPTGGGFLAGHITSVADDPAEGRFSKGPLVHLTRGRYFREGIVEGARIIREAAEKEGIPPLEVALRWIRHHSLLSAEKGDGVVLGFSKLEQLRDNLDALEKGPLSSEILEALKQAWRVARMDADHYWHMPMVYGYDTEEELFGKKG